MNSQLPTSFKILLLIAIIITTASTILSNPNKSITYFFAHGLGGTGDQRGYCQGNKIFLPNYPCYAYNGPEVATGFDAKKVVLGQEDDIAALENGLKAMDQDTESKPLIGFGISKGAATWINAAAVLKPSNLKALVLESPFADANELAYDIGKGYGLGYVPCVRSCTKLFLKNIQFPRYNPEGRQPITSIKQLPNIPMILIHSREDTLIPVNHSRKLYQELIKNGRTNVYLVEIKHGDHVRIFADNDLQGRLSYLKPVHAFYKKYNLPYDKELASNVSLKKYQPSLEEITEKIESAEESESFYRCAKLGFVTTTVGLSAYAYKYLSTAIEKHIHQNLAHYYKAYNPMVDEIRGT